MRFPSMRLPFLRRVLLPAAVTAALLAGCEAGGSRSSTPRTSGPSSSAGARSAAAVDSMLPIDEQVRRFRETVRARTDTLRGAARSRDELVRRFADALARFDTVALTRMVLDRGEFIDLYYPESRLSRAPYSMPPELLWLQLRTEGADGGVRLRHAFGPGAAPFRFVAYRCPSEPATEGRNRLWGSCVVRHLTAGDTVEGRLFGPILERDGRYKFVSYSNRL